MKKIVSSQPKIKVLVELLIRSNFFLYSLTQYQSLRIIAV